MQLISTTKLLSSLIDAAFHGSETIRNLCDEARSGNNVKFKEEGEARSAMTVADTTAQKVIVSSLLSKFPKLQIVGEEDESVEVDMEFKRDLNDSLTCLEFYMPQQKGVDAQEEPPVDLDLNEVIVYVDPLDGTREFVEGRLENVQCLIGLCYRGRPLIGAIGVPFSTVDGKDSTVEVVFGLVGKGVGKVRAEADISPSARSFERCCLPDMKEFKEGETIYLSSGDSSNEMLRAAIDSAEKVFGTAMQRQIVGACGNKILRVSFGETTISLQHDKTSLWDTAAPTAILTALGGMVTDNFGEPLIYNKKLLQNKLGVVASTIGAKRKHMELTNSMRGEKTILGALEKFGVCNEYDVLQCVDIARDLEGYPLTTNYLAKKLDIKNISSYYCKEENSVRGLMSSACRITLRPSNETVFFKRIDFVRLDHARAKKKTAPHKLSRDVKSYRVESSFLGSRACDSLVSKTGLKIPKCYDAKLLLDESSPIDSKVSLLLEDFSPAKGWTQRWLLQDVDECKIALSAFAKMHAFFWHGSSFYNDIEDVSELENAVWEQSSYVQPKLQNLDQCANVASGWEKNKLKFKDELGSFGFWEDLGERLQSVAEVNGKHAHPFADDSLSASYQKFRTFTHGDPKQANLFFRAYNSELEVGLIDFQWSGFGLAATDVAHHITAAIHADVLVNDGEEALLRHYYDDLQKFLLEFGAYDSVKDVSKDFSYSEFVRQYETGILDMCRLIIVYAWSRFEPINDQSNHGRTMNKNSYNKNISNVIWLMIRCDEILKCRGI